MANQVVELVGRGSLTLSPTCHVATGGEASVYRVADTVVKVYLDASKMSRDGMVDKVSLLRPLGTASIVAPEGVAVDKKTGGPVGFYMPYVTGEPMPRVFTTSFWQRTSFDVGMASVVAEKMREVVEHAHAHGALMVDANELNWIVSLGPELLPRVIDVDSWSVGKWGAKIIMPSIRDHHTKGFSELSDWFSWAVVTFQLYTGVHPYKGTLAGYNPSDWEKRMLDNASVFAPGVKLNAAVRSPSRIPGSLRAWYEAVFQGGERSKPPSPRAPATSAPPAAVVTHVSATASTVLRVEKLFDERTVRRVWSCGAVEVFGGEVWDVAKKRRLFGAGGGPREVVRSGDDYVLAEMVGGKPTFWHAPADGSRPAAPLGLDLSGHAFLSSSNRLFVASGSNLVELTMIRGSRPVLAVKQTIAILHPQSVQWFDGVGVERAFKSAFVITAVRESACSTIRVPELEGLRVFAGRACGRFAAFLGEDKSGEVHRVELSFDADHSAYRSWTGRTDSPELNMAVLPKGVAATIVRDGELVVFVPSTGQVTRVADPVVSTCAALNRIDDTVVWVDRGALYSVKMR